MSRPAIIFIILAFVLGLLIAKQMICILTPFDASCNYGIAHEEARIFPDNGKLKRLGTVKDCVLE
jgi:hypothetical protein